MTALWITLAATATLNALIALYGIHLRRTHRAEQHAAYETARRLMNQGE